MAKPISKRESWTTGAAGETRAFFKRVQRRARRRAEQVEGRRQESGWRSDLPVAPGRDWLMDKR
jgi:hypothetical protein